MDLFVFKKVLYGDLQPYDPSLGDEEWYKDLLSTSISYDPAEGIFEGELLNKFQERILTNPKLEVSKQNTATIKLNENGEADFIDETLFIKVNEKIPKYYNYRTEYYYYLLGGQIDKVYHSLMTGISNESYRHKNSIVSGLVADIDYLLDLGKSKYENILINGLNISHTGTLNDEEINSLLDDCIYIFNVLIISLVELRMRVEKLITDNISPLPIKQNENDFTYKSFTSPLYSKSPHELTNLCESLKNKEYIKKDTRPAIFKRIFSGRGITEKISWERDKQELRYFIKKLVEMKIVNDPKQKHFKIMANCFLLKGKEINPKGYNSLQNPSTYKCDELDYIIRLLNHTQHSAPEIN